MNQCNDHDHGTINAERAWTPIFNQTERTVTNTPETDKCVKQNKHLKFLQEDAWVNNNKITYGNPIVFLCQKLERELTEAREQRDRLAEALQKFEGCFDCYGCVGTAEQALAAVEGWCDDNR